MVHAIRRVGQKQANGFRLESVDALLVLEVSLIPLDNPGFGTFVGYEESFGVVFREGFRLFALGSGLFFGILG